MHYFPSGSGWGAGAGAGSSHVDGSNAKKYSKSSVHTGGQAGVRGGSQGWLTAHGVDKRWA